MASGENEFNIKEGLKWLLYAMVAIIVALSGFSSQQMLKASEKSGADQEKINAAITAKLDNISQQLSEQRSDNKIIQNTLAKHEEIISKHENTIEDLKNEVMDLKLKLAGKR